MALARQIWTLTKKNLVIAVRRHPWSTLIRAFLLPVIVVAVLAYTRNLFIQPSYFGIAEPRPVKSLVEAMDAAGGGRETLALVNGGFVGGDIERVIERVADPVRRAGKKVRILERPEELIDVCPSSLRGLTKCVGAAVFWSSPNEGPGGMWNYTLRADAGLGFRIDTRDADNDVQIYTIPLQHAVDFAIASLNDTVDAAALPEEVQEYMFTSKTREQRQIDLRRTFMNAMINALAVAFLIGIIGVTYHLVGMCATERELGMSALLEAMMPNARRWQPQAARLISYHLAFDLIYAPGWLFVGIILAAGVFPNTNDAIIIIHHLLAGLSMASFAIYGAAYFKKAQLSGITVTIIAVLLAILAQTRSEAGTASVAILALLFPPMNYVYFLVFVAKYERLNRPADLLRSAPGSPWRLPGVVLWVFLVLQILIFPFLGALVERSLFMSPSKGRKLAPPQDDMAPPVRIRGFTKHYPPSILAKLLRSLRKKPAETVVAVNDLSLDVPKGQILVLLGANGSGKTTTLDAVAGLSTITQGSIEVDGTGGLGLCPQKNVLWDDLTVMEHITIFNRLKTAAKVDSTTEIGQLISACDLDMKRKAKSKTLSGGQKRKLQLGMMFTGGSKVCCIDEVSSGLDPLSRRKIWDILLRERGARTIILTTHFLDEADLLADHIAILSKGSLRAEGSAVELKHKLGEGYRVYVSHRSGSDVPLDLGHLARSVSGDETAYLVATSAEAAQLVDLLEQRGVDDYRVAGPSIEDVFLKLADEVNEMERTRDHEAETVSASGPSLGDKGSPSRDREVQLLPGKRISIPRQAWIMFRKRVTILKRNFLPYLATLVIAIVGAGLVGYLLRDSKQPRCSPAEELEAFEPTSFFTEFAKDQSLNLTLGPPSTVTANLSTRFQGLVSSDGSPGGNLSALTRNVQFVDTLPAFIDNIDEQFGRVNPGGAFAATGEATPTFAYRGNGGVYFSVLTQNIFDRLLTNISINTQFAEFDVPLPAAIDESLQAMTYFGLILAVYPAFFALYPTLERLRNIRALQYSNGVRSVPLWLAYLTFDFLFVLVASAAITIIFQAISDIWYHIGYFFVVLMLYGLASTALAYVISLMVRSQLAAFAFAAAGQAIFFLIYVIAFMSVQVYAPTDKIDSYSNIVHFVVSAISPIGSLTRGLFVALNLFYINCRDKRLISYPGEITLYGGPILYLTLQSLLLFGVLLWWESGPKANLFRKNYRSKDVEEKESQELEVTDELQRVNSASNGLRALHVTKAFGSTVAVEDVTFGVGRGEVFALLGPNGAGKSTTISMIRGELVPSNRDAEILIENTSIRRQRVAARSHMGVCPQFDAMDQMTTLEHLQFYARIRGVADIEHNVREVVRAVGLASFSTRLAAKLSGGNKRKLSLAIALLGNPTVLLLDEPSSGMDAASKRVMWRTLASVVPNRSILLTTHSMEEADALAHRAGIMATRMLALGSTNYLRKKHGDAYYVHLITTTAPYTSVDDMARIKSWILGHFAHASIEPNSYHGQIRFSVPARSPPHSSDLKDAHGTTTGDAADGIVPTPARSSVSALFNLLEKNKADLGLQYYSVSQTTLDQVFLTIIGKHNVQEEGHHARQGDDRKKGRVRRWLCGAS